MMTKNRLLALAILFAALAGQLDAAGQAPVTTTTITVPDMDCAGCAKKLMPKLVTVAGVAKAESNVAARTVSVTHKPGEQISPKALWEAAHNGGFTPSKLVGPDGTFTTKPTK